jgi:hypothetical protein
MINLTTLQFDKRTNAPTIAQDQWRDGSYKHPVKQLLADLLAICALVVLAVEAVIIMAVFK